MRACIFVDGENFRHSICELFPQEFDPREYLPKTARWGEFFDWLAAQAGGPGTKRLRTYWYVSRDLEFFPYRYPSAEHEADKLRRLLSVNEDFRAELESLEGQSLLSAMNDMVDHLKSDEYRLIKRSEGWQVLQNGISRRHPAVEFRRAGAITYNLFTSQFGKEKAVDVKLAVDMILLKGNYDVAVLVSGDQDYIPAVQAVKDSGKKVVNVSFARKPGQHGMGGGKLEHNADSTVVLERQEIAEFLNV